jgi:flavin reductase (DIM6/NTAB) family NADH-FMN oxidoreductase RutF
VRRILSSLWHGRPLRHLPIALGASDEPLVRFELRGLTAEPIDASDRHVPVSMRPLVLGLTLDDLSPASDAQRLTLVSRDRASGEFLGEITLEPAGALPIGARTLSLFRTVGSRNATCGASARTGRYALAWIHARRAPSRGDGLCMSAADLRCLNVYYTWPRRVFLVGVAHDERSNLFPMDLVGRVDPDHFLLTLRATSPAIALMETSRVIAMSGAPADKLDIVYALGAHHRKASVDTSALPFPIRRSPRHGLPMLTEGFTRELTVQQVHRVGSHVLFVCRVDEEQGTTPRQLGHLSEMYVEWLRRRGRDVERAR